MACKKQILLLLVIVFHAVQSLAQAGYGVEAGIGMSSMHFAPLLGFTKASKTPVASGKIGGVFDAGINKHTYFQSGLLVSFKGHKRDYSFYVSDSLSENVEQALRLTYIDVPLNLCYKTAQQGKGRVVMGIGVTLSYLIGGSNKVTATGVDSGKHFTTSYHDKVKAGDPVKGFDAGLNLFAGYELPTGWFFRFYYTAGISDIGLGTEIDKNRMWGISAGYLLGKGRNISKEDNDLIDRSKD